MNPDYTIMVNEMVKPMIMLIMLIVTFLSLIIGFQFWKDRTKLEKYLGTETINWLLNKKDKK